MTLAPLPVAMAEVGVAALGGLVYVVGGTEATGEDEFDWASSLVLAYDPATDAWRERAPLPEGLTHVGLAALDGRLYAVGGFLGIIHMDPQTAAFAYDPEADAWTALPPLPVALGSVAVAAVDGRLHVLGGRAGTSVIEVPGPPGAPPFQEGLGTVATHEVFDPATGAWTMGAPLPGPPRDHAGIAVLDGRVHVVGGRVEDVTDNLDRHDVYDPATDVWTVAAPLPAPRSAGAYTVLDGRILYAGGECKPGGEAFTPNAYDDVAAYDPAADAWTALAPLPGARHGFGAAEVDGVAYFAAGAPVCGGGALTDMLAFTSGGA